MEYHRNPSPPDSPTPLACARAPGQSHDITITSSTDTAQPDSASHDNDDSTSLVNYDDCIGDTVFSKAWVLSLLVKAVEAVREQQSKIEISNHTEDNVDECDTEKLELSVEKRPSMLSSRTVQSDAQVMGMESQECDQPDPRDRPIQDVSSEPEQNDCLLEANSGDASTETRTKEDQREMQISGNDEDNSMQRTEKESMICETSPVDSDQEERETRGERGEDGESDGDEGDDGLFDVRERSLSDGAEISESLENDLCRLWDASMNMVCHMCVAMVMHVYYHTRRMHVPYHFHGMPHIMSIIHVCIHVDKIHVHTCTSLLDLITHCFVILGGGAVHS